ncbi:hypothetical protein ACN27F_23955 [Solwaraspora sp. WMMB335]|uniref:hypothetical protein n=1 Tax=Solwaraspora sp. WMMB335 TaxID=3404118 RepID=UPI003B923A7C
MIDEIDRPTAPGAVERVVDRLRRADERTQIVATCHSDLSADQLKPDTSQPVSVLCAFSQHPADRLDQAESG